MKYLPCDFITLKHYEFQYFNQDHKSVVGDTFQSEEIILKATIPLSVFLIEKENLLKDTLWYVRFSLTFCKEVAYAFKT